MLRLAVLASGSGTNFQAIAEAIRSGALHAQLAGVICNIPGAGVIERAQAFGVSTFLAPSKGIKAPDARERYDAELASRIEGLGAQLVVLAGYMRLLSPDFIRRFSGRIVNIHPSLLPAFPGLNVHEAVLAHGCKVTGCTVHFVDEGLDSGPIVAQLPVPVFESDDAARLAARVHAAEHRLYPWAIERIALGQARVEGRRVVLSGPVEPLAWNVR